MLSVEKYVSGLSTIHSRISELQVQLLQAQYYAQNRTVTATQLARLVKIESGRGTINLMYGRLGRLLCEAIGFKPTQRKSGTYRWWSVLSHGYEEHNPYRFYWQMYSEVADALEVLGWVLKIQRCQINSPDSHLLKIAEVYFDEVTSKETFQEGAVQQVLINSYEREPKARQKCIDHYGTNCSVCDFNFGDSFGELGKGFIHVHHLRPLSEIADEYEVDPIKDLRPVCPNCHAMIHRSSPPLSIEELRSLLIRSKAQIDI